MTNVVGIDCGHSHLTVAIVDGSERVLAIQSANTPGGDGHNREIALSRLRQVLPRLGEFSRQPATLAGYCYGHSGVREAFEKAGWSVERTFALNDVVGIYGLSGMPADVVVGGCGTSSQVVCVDAAGCVGWPGADVERELPEWLVSGRAYASFLQESGLMPPAVSVSHRWVESGRLMNELIDEPAARTFIGRAAEAVRQTVDVLWKNFDGDLTRTVILGGGAIAGERLWATLHGELLSLELDPQHVVGDPAVGLARYAIRFPSADPWRFIGTERPVWLN